MNIKHLKNFIKSVLLESKIDDLKKRHPDDAVIIDKLASNLKPKYVEWVLKQHKNGAKLEDLIPTVKFFDQKQQSFKEKDINRYTAKSLEDAVKDVSAKHSVRDAKNAKTAEVKATGVDRIFEDDTHVLLYIKNKEASICYGAGTRWCITMKNAAYYEEYVQEGVDFYFLINKTLPSTDKLSKIAFAVYRNGKNKVYQSEIFDAEDNSLDNNSDLNSFQQQMLKLSTQDAPKHPLNTMFLLKNNALSFEELLDLALSDELEIMQKDTDSDLYYLCFKPLFAKNIHWVDLGEDLQLKFFALLDKLAESDFDTFSLSIFRNLRSMMFDDDLPMKIRKLAIEHSSKDLDALLAFRYQAGKDNEAADVELRKAALKNIDFKFIPTFIKDEQDQEVLETFLEILPKIVEKHYENAGWGDKAGEFMSDYRTIIKRFNDEHDGFIGQALAKAISVLHVADAKKRQKEFDLWSRTADNEDI